VAREVERPLFYEFSVVEEKYQEIEGNIELLK